MKLLRAPSTLSLLRAIALLCLLPYAGPALAKRPPAAEEAEIQALKRQIVELQQRATMCEVDSARSRQQVSTLRSDLAAARSEVERLSSLPVAEEPVLELGEPMMPEADAVEVVELEEPAPPPAPEPLETSIASESPAVDAQVPSAGSAPETSQGPPPAEALALYDEGYTLFHQKQYAEAEHRFGEFIRKYPANDFTDNAQFWIGESLYAQGQYSEALRAFISTVDGYPDGNKVSDALFKAGKCLEALGQTEQARQTYLEVQEKFPQSAAAAGAKDRLASGF